MKISPVLRFALFGGVVGLLFTALRLTLSGWPEDLPNTLAGFGSAAFVGAAVGTYVALATRRVGKLLALRNPD